MCHTRKCPCVHACANVRVHMSMCMWRKVRVTTDAYLEELTHVSRSDLTNAHVLVIVRNRTHVQHTGQQRNLSCQQSE